MKLKELFTATTFLFVLSCTNHNQVEKNQVYEDTTSTVPDVKSGMTFIDSDSICNQVFNTTTVNDGQKLSWKIEVFENNQKVKEIVDSNNAMSYLVKASDLNYDGTGELVVVTAHDKAVTSPDECQIYCYIWDGNDWVKRAVPKLNEKQLIGYNGMEIISVDDKKITRKYPLLDKENKETGKERVLTYKLNKELELVVTQEK